MNGNQITISVNSEDLNELRKIARTRGQTVSDYVSSLVSSNLLKSSATPATVTNTMMSCTTNTASNVVASNITSKPIASKPEVPQTAMKGTRVRIR